MKPKFITVFLIVGFFVCSNSFSQDKNENSDTLNLLLNKAKTNNKNLFLVFGWQGCGWCRLLEKYHDDPQVKDILGKYFMISNIDIYKTKTGEDLYKRYGKVGTPSWTIFSIKGKVIIDSGIGDGNIGYPATENELNFYVQALKNAVPNIPQSECDILVSKLKDYRNRKAQIN
jgi:hypothetical protein